MQQDHRVPLSPARHGARFWRRMASYDFARPLRQVPLALAEVEAVAATLPVVFARGADGLGPVALLRLARDGPGGVVSPDGLWRGSYVPSLLRVHPFSAVLAGDGRLQLMVDEASGLVTDDPGDEPFFGPGGVLAPAMAGLIGFFRQREASALQARKAAARLEELGLLVPFAPTPGAASEGLLRVDRARFDALGDAQWLEVRRLGGLALVHAHLVSLAQVGWLSRAEALPGAEPARRAPEAAEGRGVEAFLAALAASGAAEAVPLPADAVAADAAGRRWAGGPGGTR